MRNLLASVLLTSLTLVAPVFGQDPSSRKPARRPEVAGARDGGDEALKLYAAGRWAEAYDTFRRANAIYHAPTLVLYMAHSKRQLGKLAEARALYQSVVDEPLAPAAPTQFWRAQSSAREELDALVRRIPALVVTVSGEGSWRARVTVDGQLLPADKRRRELDPGEHLVEVSVDEAPVFRQTVNLAEGAVVPIQVPVNPPAPARAATVADPPRRTSAPVLVAFGVGAGGLAVGATTGAIALHQMAAIVSRCQPGARCPAADQSRADAAGRLADASIASFIVGGVALATGAVLMLVRSSATASGPVAASAPLRVGVDKGALSVSF